MKWGMRIMKFSPFFFNRGVIRQSLRQHGWIGILYLTALLFALPLQMIMVEGTPSMPRRVANLFDLTGDVQGLLLLSLPVAAGLFVFRYLQTKDASDMLHSLPLKRSHLFVSHFTCGLLLLLPPVWITAAVSGAVKGTVSSHYTIYAADVLKWGLTASVISVFLYTFTVFVGVCTGQSVLQGIVVYILLLLPAALSMLMDYHLRSYLYGYSEASWALSEKWSPLIHFLRVGMNPFSCQELLVYTGLSVLFIVLSCFLYRLRHTERATQAIAFSYFNPLFQMGVMLCAMLLSSTYFSESMNRHQGWALGGYAIGAVLGYVLTEMLIRKSWHIAGSRTLVQGLGYTAVLGILLYASVSNITGFETRTPEPGTVKSIYFGNGIYRGNSYNARMSSDPALIESAIALHVKLTKLQPKLDWSNSTEDPIAGVGISYKLQNGRYMFRQYNVPNHLIQEELAAVMGTQGYKEILFAVNELDNSFDRIELKPDLSNKKLVIADPLEIREFQAILKKEILRMSMDEQKSKLRSWASIEMLQSDSKDYYYYEWLRSYKELEEWLERKGYSDKARLSPSDLTSIEAVKIEALPDSTETMYPSPESFRLYSRINPPVTVTDPQEMQQILERLTSYGWADEGYMLKLKSKTEGYEEFSFVKGSTLLP
jgi:ABC-2 type transport system permease protein